MSRLVNGSDRDTPQEPRTTEPASRGQPRPIGAALVLTALPEEHAAVRTRLTGLQSIEHERTGGLFEQGLFDAGAHGWRVLLCETGMGNERAAVAAERGIELARPEIALFVGIAGGIKDVALGDLVVPDKVYQYEYGKVEGDSRQEPAFKTRPEVNQPSFRALERARQVARDCGWAARTAHGGAAVTLRPIAAGSKVLASSKSALYQFIRDHYNDAVAVEMEGWGALEAVRQAAIEGLVVRGISDLLDGKGKTDQEGWRAIAVDRAAAFAFEVLAQMAPRTLVDLRQGSPTVPGTGPSPGPDPVPSWDEVPFEDRTALVDALLGCESVANGAHRAAFVEGLPPAIRHQMGLGHNPRIDAERILRTCWGSEGGIEALLARLASLENGMRCFAQVRRLFERIAGIAPQA